MKIWSYSQSHRIDGKGKCVEEANRFFETAEVKGLFMDTVRSYAFTLMAFFRWLKEDWKRFQNFTQKHLQDLVFGLLGFLEGGGVFHLSILCSPCSI